MRTFLCAQKYPASRENCRESPPSGATAGEPSLKNIGLQRYFERIPYWREQGITMAGAGKELAIMAVSTAPSADLKFSPHMLRYRVSSRVGGTTTSGRLENRTIVGV